MDHASDCATHNAPAMEPGECNCDHGLLMKIVAETLARDSADPSPLIWTGEAWNVLTAIERAGYSIAKEPREATEAIRTHGTSTFGKDTCDLCGHPLMACSDIQIGKYRIRELERALRSIRDFIDPRSTRFNDTEDPFAWIDDVAKTALGVTFRDVRGILR